MILKAIKIKKIHIIVLIVTILILSILSFLVIKSFVLANSGQEQKEENKYIKWVDYNVPLEIMEKTAKLDIDSHTKKKLTP